MDQLPQNDAPTPTTSAAYEQPVRRLLPLSELDDFAHKFGQPYQVWRSKCVDGHPPRFDEIDVLEDFIGSHSHIAIGERQGEHVICRLVGTAFVDLMGVDTTGTDLVAAVREEDRKAIAAYFDGIATGDVFGHAHGAVPMEGRGFVEFDTLDLPLRGADGTVTHFLAVLHVSE